MKEKIEKIVARTNDELIDVVRKISQSDAKRILVSFVESSDILISSINLKVLLDSADEKEAVLILQIHNNPTGVRNAKLADIPVVDAPGIPNEDVWESAKVEFKKRKQRNLSKQQRLPQDYKSENITSFEDRINSVLTKSQEERREKDKEEEKEGDIVIDQDISTKGVPSVDREEDLTKVDFKNLPDPIKSNRGNNTLKIFFGNITGFFNKNKGKESKKQQGLPRDKEERKKRLVALLPKILIPVVAVFVLVLFLYYRFAPYVRATIFIESKPVEIEKSFKGNKNINEIDFEEGEIPIKTESVTKSVADVVDATGVAYRGKRAEGNVAVSYINEDGCTDADEPVNLPAGQVVTTEGKNYNLKSAITVTCTGYDVVVEVEAAEVGEEYNIAAGKFFTVRGYDKSRIYAKNDSAFTGGSKEEYTVLSKEDVDKKVKELTDIAFDEAESSLNDIGRGWELIETTIKSKVKEGSVKSAVAIGTETTSSDVSLEVESSATYYYTEGVDEGLNRLLTEAALNQNLFESSEGLELTLKGDIEKELIVKDDGGDIEITLLASSSVEPSVNKDRIVKDLKGVSWDEGVRYLNELSFTAQRDPVLKFTPENFPKRLRHFPSRQGRIYLQVEELVESNS